MAKPIDKPHQPDGRSFFSDIVCATRTIIGPPMHTFRLVRKFVEHVRLPPNRIRIFCAFPSPRARFLLARIGQTVAAPAREYFAGAVEQCDAAPTVSTAGIDGTDKPGRRKAQPIRSPGRGDLCVTPNYHQHASRSSGRNEMRDERRPPTVSK